MRCCGRPVVFRNITTDAKAIVQVPARTDESVCARIRTAVVYQDQAFHYQGNHPDGEDWSNGGCEAMLAASGLVLHEDDGESEDAFGGDMYWLRLAMETGTGIWRIRHRDKVLTYHAQRHQDEQHGAFGYTRTRLTIAALRASLLRRNTHRQLPEDTGY